MKKFPIILTILVAALFGVLGLTACEEAHVHEWGEWTSDGNGGHRRVCLLDASHEETGKCEEHYVYSATTATCTEGGSTTYECAACGYTYTDGATEKLGHDYVYTYDAENHRHVGVCTRDSSHTVTEECTFDVGVKVEATCTEAGYTLKTCTVCKGTKQEDPVEALDHLWGAWQPVAETDTHVRYCTRDGCTQKQDAQCSFSQLKEHKEPTCTENGYDVYECPECHDTVERDEVPTSGHNWSLWQYDEAEHKHHKDCSVCGAHEEDACIFGEVVVPATCTTDGYTIHGCPLCQGTYQTFDAATQSATGHTYPDTWEMDPESKGSHYHTCLNCDERETKNCEYDASSTAPDCKHKGITTYTCPDCNYSYTTQTEEYGLHTYGAWQTVAGQRYHKRVCSVCSHEDTVNCEYTPVTVNATCTAAGKTTYTCNTCHGSYEVAIDKLAHDWSAKWQHDDSYTQGSRHYRTCQTCGTKDYKNCTMKRVNGVPTCTNPADVNEVCEDCLYSKDVGDVAALGHQWGEWKAIKVVENGETVYYHEHSCTRANCEAKAGSKAYTERQKCVFEATTVNSTCLTAGTTTFSCPHCTNSYTEVTGKALGHDYGPFTPIGGSQQQHKKVCMRPNCDGGEDSEIVVTCSLQKGETVDPTCLTGGYTVYTCSDCEGVYHLDTKDALGHDYDHSMWTTGNDGTHYRLCTRDNNHRETVNCSYDTGDVIKPTCTDAGYTLKTCTVCRYQQRVNEQRALGHEWEFSGITTMAVDNSTHLMKCNRCTATEQQSCVYTTQTVPATCTAPAQHIHTCSVCAHVYTHDEGQALGHAWGSYTFNSADNTHSRVCTRSGCTEKETPSACTRKVVKQYAATCKTYGYTEYRCDTCGGTSIGDQGSALGEHVWSRAWAQSLDGETHYRTCTVCLAKDSRPCNMETVSEEKATCTASGYAIKRCNTCTRFERENYTKLGHDFGSEINTWISNGAGKHYRECSRCNYREEQSCTMRSVAQAPTCKAAGKTGQKCTVCTYSIGVADVDQLNHKMGPVTPTNDGHHTQTCLNGCGYVETEECTLEGTDATEATCTVPAGTVKTCSKCGYHVENITKPALGHSWHITEKTDSSHTATCNREGCNETSSGAHDADCNICSVCGYDSLTYEYGDKGQTFYVVKDDSRIGKAKHVIIPDTHEGKPVKAVRQFAFQTNKAIETVEIANTVETIEMYAFSVCENLKSVTFTEVITDYSQQTKADPAFKTIEMYAFSSCFALTSIELPKSIKTIGTYAFHRCLALKNIVLPETDVTIENNAFTDTGLFNDRNSWVVEDHALYLAKHLIRVYPDFEGTFTIKGDTITVGAGAFEGCVGLTEVSIPDTVKTFDTDAFLGCTGLQKVTYTGTIDEWLSLVFENDCASPLHYATELSIEITGDSLTNDAITSIPAGTFRGRGLKTVNLKNVTYIGAHAFENCADLISITLPDTLTYIGEDAFKGTKFYNTADKWTNGLLYIGNHLIAANDEEIANHNDGAVEIKDNTRTISPKTFYQFKNIKSVVIPSTIQWIGERAFANSSLQEATFKGAESMTFFATNLGGAGRWISKDQLTDRTQAAILLRYYYPNEWKRR